MDKDIKFQLQILSIKFFIYEECNIHVVDKEKNIKLQTIIQGCSDVIDVNQQVDFDVKLQKSNLAHQEWEDYDINIVFTNGREVMGNCQINLSFFINSDLPQFIVDKININNDYDQGAYLEYSLSWEEISNKTLSINPPQPAQPQFNKIPEEQSNATRGSDEKKDTSNPTASRMIYSSYSSWKHSQVQKKQVPKQNIPLKEDKIQVTSQWEETLRNKGSPRNVNRMEKNGSLEEQSKMENIPHFMQMTEAFKMHIDIPVETSGSYYIPRRSKYLQNLSNEIKQIEGKILSIQNNQDPAINLLQQMVSMGSEKDKIQSLLKQNGLLQKQIEDIQKESLTYKLQLASIDLDYKKEKEQTNQYIQKLEYQLKGLEQKLHTQQKSSKDMKEEDTFIYKQQIEDKSNQIIQLRTQVNMLQQQIQGQSMNSLQNSQQLSQDHEQLVQLQNESQKLNRQVQNYKDNEFQLKSYIKEMSERINTLETECNEYKENEGWFNNNQKELESQIDKKYAIPIIIPIRNKEYDVLVQSLNGKQRGEISMVSSQVERFNQQIDELNNKIQQINTQNERLKLQNQSIIGEQEMMKNILQMSDDHTTELERELEQMQDQLRIAKQNLGDAFNTVLEYGGSQLLEQIERSMKLRRFSNST